MWYGNASTVPSGWAICNGQNSTPDLRNRFIIGAGLDFGGWSKIGWANGWNNIGPGYIGVGMSGGEEQHRLTIPEMPSHSHSVNVAMWTTEGVDFSVNGRTGFAGVATAPIHPTGGDQPHNILPPYIAVYYIVKL